MSKGPGSIDPTDPPSQGSARRRISTLLVVVAAVSLVLASVAAWTRATVLDSDRFVTVVSAVAGDPRVIASVSERLATQTVVALDVEARIADVLPPRAAFLAATLTERIQAAATDGIARFLATERAQTAWAGASRRLHERLLAVLREESDRLVLEDGVLSLDLFPVVVTAIAELQSNGVIPARVPLPDLSAEEDLEAARQRLGAALGVALPSELGKVAVVDAPVLERLRTVVRLLDALVVWLVAATVVAGLAAVALSTRRSRSVLWMTLLAIGLIVVIRLIVDALARLVVGDVDDARLGITLSALLEHFQADLLAWLGAILVAIAVVAVVAWLVHRRPWRGVAPLSGGDALVLVVAALGGGVVWALLGREVALLMALVLAGWALWSTHRSDLPRATTIGGDGGGADAHDRPPA